MEWRPIETAPRDGTLLRTLHPKLAPKVRVGFWRRKAGRWGYERSNNMSEPRNQPTHWMPLPEPPLAHPRDDG
jgi:hypothetical protein